MAKVAVFFIDDLQAVRRGEIGNSDDIERLALEHGPEVYEHELEAQFRCGGADGFVRWVEQTLQIRRSRVSCDTVSPRRAASCRSHACNSSGNVTVMRLMSSSIP